jgi:hypothetical protein
MASRVYRIQPWAGGWGVFEDSRVDAVEPFRTQGDAVVHAKELASGSDEGAQVIVQGEDGRILSEFFYQRDEREGLRAAATVPTVAASAPAKATR